MKCRFFRLICFLLAGLFWGCDPQSSEEMTSQISLPQAFSKLLFSPGEDCQQITFMATTSWSVAVSVGEEWLSVSKINGDAGFSSLKISAQKNQGDTVRQGEIQITSGEACCRIEVVQKENIHGALEISEEQLILESTSGSTPINVKTEQEWSVSQVPDWLILSPSQGKGRAIVKVLYGPNVAQDRDAVIVFTASDMSKELKIRQKGVKASQLSINCSEQKLEALPNSFKIEVISNTSWSVKDVPDWMAADPLQGNEGTAVTFFCKENPDIYERNARIVFSAGALIRYLDVSQMGMILKADVLGFYKTSYSFTDSITITAADKWSLSGVPSWLVVSPTEGGVGNTKVKFRATENSTEGVRQVLVLFQTEAKKLYFNIMQDVKRADFDLYLDRYIENVGQSSGSFTVNVFSSLKWNATSEVDWLSLDCVEGIGNVKMKINYAANTNPWDRIGKIWLSTTGSSIYLQVRQARGILPVLNLDKTNVVLTAEAGGVILTITNNTQWRASEIPSWIKLSAVEGSGLSFVKLTYEANAGEARSATIVFTAGELIQTLAVSQFGLSKVW